MANVSYKLKDMEKRVIGIGYVGENDHMHVLIDCTEAFDEYPNAVATMAITPPDGESYPKSVTRNGNIVEWLVKDSDVTAEGYGEFQLTFTEGETIRKSVPGRFMVTRSISGDGEVPSGVDDWLTDANEKLAAVEEAIQEAEDAAENQPKINTSGYWEIWDAETGAYVATTVKAQGDKGDPGDPGSPGDPTELIDDTAGEGDTGKTWSADKLDDQFGGVLTAIQGIEDLTDSENVTFQYELEVGAINGSGEDVDTWYYTDSSCRTAGYIDISGSISLLVNLTRASGAILPNWVENFYTYLFFYDAYKAFISRTGGAGVTEIDTDSIPEGTKYARISFTYTRLQNVAYSSFTGEKVIGSNIPIVQKVKRLDGLSITVPQKGIVLGDSISFGLWSYWDGDQRKNADDIYSDIDKTAAPIRISDWLAQYYGIPIDNIAKRGTGWVADTRNLGNAWAKAQTTDFSQYDLVALCYGVNDYIQKCTMGSIENNTVGTIIGNMIHTLEKIYTDNPLAKVVVFSPLNCWGQCRSTVQNPVYYGDASTHYALGYDFNGTSFTLQALIDAMESVCDRYDVRHVVMSQGCTVNVFNIKDILIDGLHPSQESMKSIASDMYHEMMFR